jgi:hypothetical protein
LALLCVLLTAGMAAAVDVDLKGMYYARGSYIDNDNGLSENDTANYFYFDHELDLTARLLVTDKTRVIVNMEIHDENWVKGNTDDQNYIDGAGQDDNIAIKRVFSSHTFDAYGTVLDLGLMTGGAWATGFGDNANGRYRVKVVQPTAMGPVIAVYEKNNELGSANSSVKDSEKDDGNAYYLAMVTQLGGVNIKPLVGYVDASNAVPTQSSKGVQQILFLFGVDGTFGDIGFEAEFNYFDVDQSDIEVAGESLEDYNKYGVYGKGWWNIGAGQVGLLAAYGSWDNDSGQGFGFGEDFTPTVFGADWAPIGITQGYSNANNAGQVLSQWGAVAMFQLFGSLALSEELSINGSGLYWTSTADENANGTDNFWKDSDGYEIDLGLDWKITDQVTYTIAGGYGKIKLDGDGKDANGGNPDAYTRLYHKFQIDF